MTDKEANIAARDYCTNTKHVAEYSEEADGEVLIYNLRFMAFHAGWDAGKAFALKSIDKKEFLGLMRFNKESMYDYMEGCGAEEFIKYDDLWRAYSTIVDYLEKEVPEHER